MKFSILLPTRNRLDLLLLAVESVRSQDYENWEIVISDNASEVGVAATIEKLGDARIRVRRLNELVPVTDNWNAALEAATGDYFIMLGDDDVLVPGGLADVRRLLAEWHEPDVVYAQAHQYAYPDVVPGHPEPFVQTGYNAFLEGVTRPFRLRPDVARDMARAALEFRILYGFNMQHFVLSRRIVDRLRSKGPFFQSPYPDYYAANSVFLAEAMIVVTPDPVCMIGISPKSFGFYYVNARESDGMAFLQNVVDPAIAARLSKELVPGTNMNDSWLCAMETLKRNFPEAHARVDYLRYRRLQYHAILSSRDPARYRLLLKTMRFWEIVAYGLVAVLYTAARLVPVDLSTRVRDSISHALFSRSPKFDPHIEEVPYRDILQAARGHAR